MVWSDFHNCAITARFVGGRHRIVVLVVIIGVEGERTNEIFDQIRIFKSRLRKGTAGKNKRLESNLKIGKGALTGPRRIWQVDCVEHTIIKTHGKRPIRFADFGDWKCRCADP